MARVELGEIYKGPYTGFGGMATVRAEYLYGCVRVTLEASWLKEDGGVVEGYFDEQRLIASSDAEVGGPYPMIPPRTAPPRR